MEKRKDNFFYFILYFGTSVKVFSNLYWKFKNLYLRFLFFAKKENLLFNLIVHKKFIESFTQDQILSFL